MKILDSGEEEVLKSRNILIDCGKYFWASALKTFPKLGVDHLDAVILTHAHADAFFGLDDLRDFANTRDGGTALSVHVKETDLPELARTYPYLMNKGQTANNMHVPALSFEFYPPNAPFTVLGLEFTPLPVHHGPGVLCSAFLFGNCVYMADVNEIPQEVSALLLSRFAPFSTSFASSTISESPQDTRPHLDLLILDALWPEVSYNSHFSLRDAVREFTRFRPTKGLCTGMSHEIEYHQYSEYLKTISAQHQLDLDLSYDGLVLPISLPPSSSFWLAHINPLVKN